MKHLWFSFLSLSRFKQIGVCVLIAHLVILFILAANHVVSSRFKPRKPIAIRMALAAKPTPSKTDSSDRSSIKKAQPTVRSGNKPDQKTPVKAKPKAIEKKTEVKKLAESKKTAAVPEPKKRTTAPAEEAKSHKEILDQIASSLDAISSPAQTQPSPKFALALPSSIEMQNGVRDSKDRPSYGEMISAILQSNLDLPEYGEVVAKIEINASGIVTKCEILEMKSRKNADFIKKRLQELAFPCFNEFGLSEPKINFTITFHNDEYR